jgi:hypothetical protein
LLKVLVLLGHAIGMPAPRAGFHAPAAQADTAPEKRGAGTLNRGQCVIAVAPA